MFASATWGARPSQTSVATASRVGSALCGARSMISGAPHVPIVGFDDTPIARALGLSSVAQPVVRAARTSISLLVSRLAEERPPQHVLLPPSPVYRDSKIATQLAPEIVGTIQDEEISHT